MNNPWPASADTAYQSMLMQNHRLRVMLMLERKGVSTLNLSGKVLQYINDGFKVGMQPDQLADGLIVLIPVWEKEKESYHDDNRPVQSH